MQVKETNGKYQIFSLHKIDFLSARECCWAICFSFIISLPSPWPLVAQFTYINSDGWFHQCIALRYSTIMIQIFNNFPDETNFCGHADEEIISKYLHALIPCNTYSSSILACQLFVSLMHSLHVLLQVDLLRGSIFALSTSMVSDLIVHSFNVSF